MLEWKRPTGYLSQAWCILVDHLPPQFSVLVLWGDIWPDQTVEYIRFITAEEDTKKIEATQEDAALYMKRWVESVS